MLQLIIDRVSLVPDQLPWFRFDLHAKGSRGKKRYVGYWALMVPPMTLFNMYVRPAVRFHDRRLAHVTVIEYLLERQGLRGREINPICLVKKVRGLDPGVVTVNTTSSG